MYEVIEEEKTEAKRYSYEVDGRIMMAIIEALMKLPASEVYSILRELDGLQGKEIA